MPNPSRDALIDTLRKLLGDAFAAHQKGGAGARLGRAYGMADGFMLALIDLGVATRQELGLVVVEERTRRLGPATKTLVATPESGEATTDILAA